MRQPLAVRMDVHVDPECVGGDGAGHATPQGLAGGTHDRPAPLVFGRRRPNLKPGPAGKRALCLDLQTGGRVDPGCGWHRAMVQ
jgi:hypothetical protein